MGTIILSSIPLRRLETRLGQTSDTTLGVVGSAYGALSGASIGPGMLLTPLLAGVWTSQGGVCSDTGYHRVHNERRAIQLVQRHRSLHPAGDLFRGVCRSHHDPRKLARSSGLAKNFHRVTPDRG